MLNLLDNAFICCKIRNNCVTIENEQSLTRFIVEKMY